MPDWGQLGAFFSVFSIMVRDFFRWWLSRLAELLPASLRLNRLTEDAMIVAPIGPIARGVDGVAVSLRRGGKETPLGRFGLSATALAELPRAGSPTVLRLAEADILTKSVVLPLAAERNLDQVLGFEMDRETPFRTEELYWSHRVEGRDRQSGRLSVRLMLVPRANLAALLAALGQVGIVPRRAEAALGPGEEFHLPLAGEDRGRGGRSRLAWPVAAGCALLAIAAIVLPFVRQGAVLDRLGQEIAGKQRAVAEVERLRHEIAQLSGSLDIIAKERARTAAPLAAIAAATRVLPDNTYLTEMMLRQRKITLTGRSAAASQLIAALATDAEFKNPAFAAPVTHLPGTRTELFTIVAEVAR